MKQLYFLLFLFLVSTLPVYATAPLQQQSTATTKQAEPQSAAVKRHSAKRLFRQHRRQLRKQLRSNAVIGGVLRFLGNTILFVVGIVLAVISFAIGLVGLALTIALLLLLVGVIVWVAN